ncbi:SprT-like domain-containing protein [Salinicoccus hispanicus]|uniref:SprT domain-containing protein n=1 Tax=Salinicoccus hispanicus TaxID=157225 RepID=A0A6N8TYB2_9STAP|nr:SprT-like domain-containing protein [Salinicoccus hispanicus]MXQ49997.1 sprT domain-containing protein [Salinicoccus hispanicus]
MEQRQLERYADDFLKREFDMPLGIPLRISKRMKSKLGAFRIKYVRGKKNPQGMEIVMSDEFIKNNPVETILDVLYHECVHYALFVTGQPYKDSDPVFIRTLDRLGISKTRTHMYKGQSHLYECRSCRYQFSKNTKGYEKRYICRRCRGKFSYVGMTSRKY